MQKTIATRVFVLWITVGFACAHCDAGQPVLRHLQSIALAKKPNHIAISADGHSIATVSGKSITTIYRPTETKKRWSEAKRIVDITVSKTGRLATVNRGTIVTVYEKKTWQVIQHVHRRDALTFLRKDGQRRVSFFPSGMKLISTGQKKRLYISDVKTGGWDHIIWVKAFRSDQQISPDGKFVAVFGPPNPRELSGQILMFKVRRGLQPLWTRFHTGSKPATFVAFSPKSDRVASCGAGDGVRIWEVGSGKPVAHLQLGTKHPAVGVAFVGDGRHVVVAAGHELQIREIKSGNTVARHSSQHSIHRFSAAAGGTTCLTSGDAAKVDVWTIAAK